MRGRMGSTYFHQRITESPITRSATTAAIQSGTTKEISFSTILEIKNHEKDKQNFMRDFAWRDWPALITAGVWSKLSYRHAIGHRHTFMFGTVGNNAIITLNSLETLLNNQLAFDPTGAAHASTNGYPWGLLSLFGSKSFRVSYRLRLQTLHRISGLPCNERSCNGRRYNGCDCHKYCSLRNRHHFRQMAIPGEVFIIQHPAIPLHS